ncbi:MAG: phosphopyruvate hydratase, partial [Elusimicrobiaceae bacterium]
MIAFDGTENKSRLGANALLGVSMAALRVGAESRKVPLYEHIRKVYGLKETEYIIPAPMLNIVNGGRHADSGLDVQEFMVVPTGAAKFSDALRKATEVYHNLKKILAGRKMTVSVGDEGGFAPHIRKHDEVLETIMEAVETAGYCGDEIKIAIDAAASEFYSGGKYKFEGKSVDAKKMTAIYTGWAKRFPVISLEDPLSEDDWEGWQYLTGRLGDKITIVGDDLFVTNPGRLETGIKSNAANAILIKLNQIGTVTETVDVIAAAHKAKYNCVISHRSGETEDSFIADLAVATNAGAIKTGAPCRSERLCKYNQLLRIEEELGRKAQYAQGRVFKAVK